MARKKKPEIVEVKPPVTLRVRREHIEYPHSIERRWQKGELVDARMEDHRHTDTIGAKTVNQIFLDNGAHRPRTNEDVMEITFSKAGEIVVILPVREETKPVLEKKPETGASV